MCAAVMAWLVFCVSLELSVAATVLFGVLAACATCAAVALAPVHPANRSLKRRGRA